MNRARTLISGIAALLALAASLIGVPAALVALGGNPLPDHLPSLGEAWTAVSTPDASGTLFIAILTIAGWLGWASFAASTLVEIAGAVSSWQPPALPGPMGLAQGSSSILVGAVVAAIALLGATTAAPEASAATTTSSNAITATSSISSQTQSGPQQAQSTSTTQEERGGEDRDDAQQKVTVSSGDTLWEIADEQLGDGTRYDELADATEGTTQPDGQQLTDPDLIQPGWTINVPSDGGASSTTPKKPSKNTTPEKKSATPNDATPKTDADEANPHSEPSASTPADASPQTAGDAGRSESSPAPSGPPTTTSSNSEGSPESNAPVMVTAAGLGSLAAAGVLTLLRRRRSRQSQHREPGKRVALPTGDAAIAEAQMRAAADPVGAADLDRVMRSLAAHAHQAGTPLPALRAARLCTDSLELYLVHDDATLPEPFTPDGDGVWVLERADMTEDVLLSDEQASEHLAPYPTLVTAGHDHDGAHVLLNLEELRSLAIQGDEEVCTAALTAMTVELLGSEWTDDTRITLVGVMPELIDAVGSDRATYVDTVGEILTALEYTSGVVRGALDDAGAASAQDARTAGVVDDSWTPHLILLTGPIGGEDQERLSQVLQATPRVAVASVVTGTPAMGEWALTLEGSTSDPSAVTGSLAPIGLHITPQLLPHATYEATLDAFRAADLPDVDGPDWTEGISDGGAVDLDAIVVPEYPVPLDSDDDPYGLTEPAPDEEDSDADTDETIAITAATPVLDDEDFEDADTEDDEVETETEAAELEPAPVDEDLETIPEDEDDEPATAASTHSDDAPSQDLLEPTVEDTHPVEKLPQASPADVLDQDEGDQPLALPVDRPQVRLLGPVHVANATGKKPTAPRRMTEIVAYLALHGGQGPQAFTEAIFPIDRSKKTGQKRNQYMTSARNWLGHAPEGQPYVAIVDEAGYHLDDETAVDWWLFQDLVGNRIGSAPTRNLRAALDLVDGQPLSGTEEDRYVWADTDRQEIIAAVADVAHELARRCLDIGDARTAALAAAKGLEVEPVSEALWRDAIAAAYATGRPGRAQHVIADCRRRLDEYGDLEEETIDLINDVLTRVREAHPQSTPEPAHS